MINPLSFVTDKMKNWAIVLLTATLVLGLVGAYFYGRSDGRSLERAKAAAETIKQIERRNEINEDVENLDDCALIVELGGVCVN